MNNIKILVGYHRPSILLKSDVLVPIHLGRALATEASKDGKMSQEDYQWMLDNMIGDDTGDNISYLNRYLCEMSGIYWAWKNYDKLGNPDYIGFMHYRRIFDFTYKTSMAAFGKPYFLPYTHHLSKNYIKKYGLTKKSILNVVKTADICHTTLSNREDTIENWFLSKLAKWCQLDTEVFSSVFNAIDKDSYDVDAYLNSHEHYEFNCFVMKKEMFFKYCEFMFSVLLPQIDKLDFDSYTGKHSKRVLAFISERLTGMFIFQQRKNHIAFKEIPLIHIEDTSQYGPSDDSFLSLLRLDYIRLLANYYRCKLLSKVTVGKMRKHYKEKKKKLKADIRQRRNVQKGK